MAAISGAGAYSEVSYSVGGDTRSGLESTIEKLKKQREECEQEKLHGGSGLDTRIRNLEQRIEKLKSRLEKLKGEDGECQTCKNRKYQDGSDDPGVSFKTAARVGPEGAEAAVRGHEHEHVVRDRAEAAREDREVVSQTVRIKHAVCPECGSVYASGGVTNTVTKPKTDARFSAGTETNKKGGVLNTVA